MRFQGWRHMSKQSKKGLVPELRFSEFEEKGEWVKRKLIDVTDKHVKWSFIGGPFGSNLKSSDYVPDGVRVIQLQNIGDAEFMDDYKIFTSEEKANELLSNNIYPKDIILSKMGDPVGRACLIPDNHPRYVMCSDGIRLVVDQEKFSKYFVYMLINSAWFRASVEKAATGSTRKRIGLDDLKKLPLIVPKLLKEQQKIADCLSSLDELIAALTQKYQTLQLYKKGLLQNLFPAEGETIPTQRFPEFVDSGEWKEEELGKLLNYLQPTRYLVSSTAYKDTYVTPVLTAGKTFILGYTNEVGGIYSDNLPVIIFDDFTTATQFVNFPFKAKSSAMKILTAKNNTNIKFIFELMRNLQYEVEAHERHWISIFSKLNVFVPKNSKEQQKIADCLSSIDDLITAQAQRIENLKTHKKGLMQQLFPIDDEVSV